MHVEPSHAVRVGTFDAPGVLGRAIAKPALAGWTEGIDMAEGIGGARGSHQR